MSAQSTTLITASTWAADNFDHESFHLWNPILLVLLIATILANGSVVLAVLRSRQLKADLLAYSANGMLTFQCVLTLIGSIIAGTFRVIIMMNDGWSELACNLYALHSVFLVTTMSIILINLTIERLMSVVFLRRTKPRQVLIAIVASVLGGAGNAFLHFTGHHDLFSGHQALYGRAGMTCFPAAVFTVISVLDIIILSSNALCMAGSFVAIYWKLASMFKRRIASMADLAHSAVSRSAVSQAHGQVASSAATSIKNSIRYLSPSNTREARIQRIFVFRGSVSVIGFTIYAVIFSLWIAGLYSTREMPTVALEVGHIVVFHFSGTIDALVFIATDRRLRSAMMEQYFWMCVPANSDGHDDATTDHDQSQDQHEVVTIVQMQPDAIPGRRTTALPPKRTKFAV
ncbi:hypothetical protein BC828DRAFT_377450 [Blastocladiella britannica]|nr:hypothetical protein BC828DRAFT_377450 [Blastocladiella britannica]